MKSEIREIRVNPWLKNEKNRLIKGKSTKIAPVFIQYKPNVKNIKIGVSSFETSKYEILPAWRGKKANPIKANSNPICGMAKFVLSSFMTSKYEKSEVLAGEKQTQNKANSNPI